MPRPFWFLGPLLILSAAAVFGHPWCLLSSAVADSLEVPEIVLEAQARRIEVMRRAAEATISIFGLDGGGGGSGVLISPDGFALTNYHVSSACGDHMRCGLSDGGMVDAVIVGVDAVGDVSLIQLLGRDNFPIAPMGDSSLVRPGQLCFSAGNPFGLASNRQPSVSLGIISGVNRYQYPAGTILEYADCIQTDAAVNPGNSGGPLFNMNGEVIGINGRCSFEKRGRVNVGVGYAISINQIRNFLGMLHSGRLLDHATLGATVASDDTGKVLVSNILSSSDAYRRGLRFGDEVLRFADREVASTNTFKNILGTLPKDMRVPVEIRRSGQNQTILVRLAGVHSPGQLIELVRMGLGDAPPQAPTPRQLPEPAEQEQQDGDDSGRRSADSIQPLSMKPNFQLVQSRLELRPGFANYFYNRQKRSHFWNQLQGLGDFQATHRWILSGRLAGERTEAELSLDDKITKITIGSRSKELQGDVSDVVAGQTELGLAVAIKALRELLQRGPEQIGDSIYLGSLPVYRGAAKTIPKHPWAEVIETVWYDAKVRFFWDPIKNELALIEVFGDEGIDPAEIYLDRYQDYSFGENNLRFPSLVRLQYGADISLMIELEKIEFQSSSTEQSSGRLEDARDGSMKDREEIETRSESTTEGGQRR
jgi:serine protease Do